MTNIIRCPARVPRITKEIKDIWSRNSQLRLGQYIYNALYFHGLSESQIFYLEDERLLEILKEYDKKLTEEEKKK